MFSFRWLAKEMNLKPLAIQGRRSLMNIGDSGYKVDAPLMLPDDEVHLWRVDLDAIRSEEFHWLKVLSEDEVVGHVMTSSVISATFLFSFRPLAILPNSLV